MNDLDYIATSTVNAAIHIHRTLGPRLLESAYENSLAYKLRGLGLEVEQQVPVKIKFEGVDIGPGYYADLIIEGLVLIELKSVKQLLDVHTAQTLTYMRLGGFELGLLMNFGQPLLKDGIRRLKL